ncbi:hypothetical protein FACS189461_3480 [Spirochaetia bacterium]|nr:hypothetical protein FACS189461_3480 [Spirochaetia bacterium]
MYRISYEKKNFYAFDDAEKDRILAESGRDPEKVAVQRYKGLGLMMSWAMTFSALPVGAWWAFLPVVLVIALVTFSLNLINSGLDQIFNPQIRG